MAKKSLRRQAKHGLAVSPAPRCCGQQTWVACSADRRVDQLLDRGVEVSSSWGAATIPGEVGDPSAALQLADVRMYAQKESRRTAHPGVAIAGPEMGLGVASDEPQIEARRG